MGALATLIVIRRDATATFQHLRETWVAKLGSDLTLLWDRRTSGRRHLTPLSQSSGAWESAGRWRPSGRTASTRRAVRSVASSRNCGCRNDGKAQPRRRAPDTWGTLGFLMVRDEGGPP
jgi:hypothetical protein